MVGVNANIDPIANNITTDGLYYKSIYGDTSGSFPYAYGNLFAVITGGQIGFAIFVPKDDGETPYRLYIKYLWSTWGSSWVAVV